MPARPLTTLPALVVAAALLAACHHAVPVSTGPTPEQLKADSIAAAEAARGGLARRDSIAAAARAQALAESQRQQRHADSVRAQVNGEMGMEGGALTRWGLSEHDSLSLADRMHFAFDKSDLTAEDLNQLEAKRLILVAHPAMVVEIDGNCDERGSDEYNLALGQRRAAAAKRWLVAHGIADSRISIKSYGEERPLDPGHDEGAWAKNRRDEFLVTRVSG